MAKITRRIIEERYAPGKRVNSLYQEQSPGVRIAEEAEISCTPRYLYYVDKSSGALKMKKTSLERW